MPARRRAETALARLLLALEEERSLLVVLGGLVPHVLGVERPGVPRHIGTTDVDILLDVRTKSPTLLVNEEKALVRMGFSATEESLGWRWVGNVDERPVKMEFLCELDDVPAESIVRAEGCDNLAAANLRGVGFVREDWHEVDLFTLGPDGSRVLVPARFAGLEGYLLAKAFSMIDRSLDKDYYDFVYVLIYNRRGGPRGAAAALKEGRFSSRLPSLRRIFSESAFRFEVTDAIGPRAYAAQSRLGDPDADEARCRNDAVSAVREFLDVLDLE